MKARRHVNVPMSLDVREDILETNYGKQTAEKGMALSVWRGGARHHSIAPGGGPMSGATHGCAVDGGPLRHGYSRIPGTNRIFWCGKCAQDPGNTLADLAARAERHGRAA